MSADPGGEVLHARRSGRPARPPAPTRPSRLPRRLSLSSLGLPLLLLLALALLFPGPLLRGEIFASADARNADSFTVVGDAALARGIYPQWNPYLFAGMPTFGSLAYTRGLYPPALLFDFLQNRAGFPPLTWMLAHLLFGGLGMAWLLGRWRLSAAARALGALLWIASPNVLAWAAHGHGSKLGAAMYLPWLIGAALAVLTGGGRRSVALCGLLLGLQIVRGHVQITYYTLLAVGLLALVHTLWPFSPAGGAQPAPRAGTRWRRAAALAVALALGFLIGAAMLYPVHGYAGLSIRGLAGSGGGAEYGYATNWSFSPAELPTLALPSASGFGRGTYQGPMPFTDYPNYLGLLPLLLAAAAAGSGRGRLAFALGLLSLLSLLVSFGRHGPWLYDLLYRHLPFFNKFRVPAMILVLPGFAVAALAPVGLDLLCRGGAEARRLRAFFTWLVPSLGALLLLLGASGLARDGHAAHLRSLAAVAGRASPTSEQLGAAWTLHQADLVRLGLLLVAAGALWWAARHREGWRTRWLPWALAALAALDLGSVGRLILHPERGLHDLARDAAGRAVLVRAAPLLAPHRPARAVLAQDPAYRAAAARAGHDRVWPLGRLEADQDFMVAGARSLGGYHPAKLAAYEQVRQRLADPQAPAARLAAWLAGRVVALPFLLPEEALPMLRDLGADLVTTPFHRDGMALYENRAALPRARLVDAYLPASELPAGGDLGAFLDRLQSGLHPFASTVVLDEEPSPRPQPAPAPLPPPLFLTDDLNEVTLRTAAPTPSILLLADMHAPGWRVEIDGRAAPSLVGDLMLRAVAVPAGEHTVRWTYRDPNLVRGLLLSAAGLLIALVLAWPPRRRATVAAAPARGATA